MNVVWKQYLVQNLQFYSNACRMLNIEWDVVCRWRQGSQLRKTILTRKKVCVMEVRNQPIPILRWRTRTCYATSPPFLLWIQLRFLPRHFTALAGQLPPPNMTTALSSTSRPVLNLLIYIEGISFLASVRSSDKTQTMQRERSSKTIRKRRTCVFLTRKLD